MYILLRRPIYFEMNYLKSRKNICKTALLKATFIIDSLLESHSKISHKEEGPKADNLTANGALAKSYLQDFVNN